ncbi:unnamed protein product [Closterium sp. Naga37s-1]|nr:unnamed protein product [Closterium sp. Naga37s-1]
MERDGSAGKAEPFHQAGAREQSGAGAAARTGAQQGARGSHSGAWAGQPGEWAREAGAGWDGDWLGEARRRAGPWEGRPLAVVSLFDGCGAIWQALHDCGIPFTGVSSEIVSAEPLGALLGVVHAGCGARWVWCTLGVVHAGCGARWDPFAVVVQQDPFAAEVVRHRWPAVQHVGDITALTPTTIHSALAAAAAAASCATAGATAGAGAAASAANTKELRPRKCKEASPNVPAGVHVDLLVGGFPCQDLSSMNRNRVGLHGPRSGLFFHLLRLIQQLSPRWFLVENVASMQWMDRDEISKYLGVPPVCIDCADLTAQARRRLFWTNLPLPAQMPPVRCHPSTLLQSKLCNAIATEDKCGPIMKTNYRTAGKGRTNQVICLRSHAARFFLSHEIERIFGFPPGYTKIPAARFAAIKVGRRGATGGKAGAGKGQENGTGNWESAGADWLRGEEREEEKEDVREVNSEEGVKIERGVMSEGVRRERGVKSEGGVRRERGVKSEGGVRRERGVKSEGGVKEVDAAVPSDPSVPPFSPVRVLNRAVFDGVREVREEEGEEAEVREVKEGEVRGVREVSACIAGGDGGKGGAEGFDVVGRDGGKWVLGVAAKASGERGKHKGGEARRWVEGKRNGVANGEREGGGGKRRRVWKGRDGGELQGAARCDAVRSGDCVDADGDEGDDGFDGYHGGAAANGASGLKSENAVKSGDVGVLKEDNAVENGHATDHEDSEDDVVEVPPSVLGDEKVGEKKGRREDGGGQAKAREDGGGQAKAREDGGGQAKAREDGGGQAKAREDGGGQAKAREDGGGQAKAREDGGGQAKAREDGGGQAKAREDGGGQAKAREDGGGQAKAREDGGGAKASEHSSPAAGDGASAAAPAAAGGSTGRSLRARPSIGFYSEAELMRRGVQQQPQETRRRRSGASERASGRADGMSGREETCRWDESKQEELQERDRWGLLGNSFPVAVISYLLTPLLSPSLRLSAPPCALPACVPPHVTRAKCALMVPGEVWAAYSWSKLPNWYALILSVEGGRFDIESLRKPTPLCITYRYFYLVDAQSAGHPANGKREEREESESGDEEEEEEDDEDEEGDEYKGEGEDEHTWHGAGLYEMEQETHTATSLTVFSHRVRRVRRVAGGAGRSVHAVYPQPGTVWALKWPFKRDFSLVYVVTSSIEFNPRSLSSPSPSSHPSPTTSPSLQPSPTPSRAPPASPTASRASIRAFSATVRALVRRRSVKMGVGMDPLWGVHEHEWQVDDLSAFAFEAPFHFHSDRHTLVVEPQTHKEPE